MTEQISTIDMFNYIKTHVSDLDIGERREIANMISNSTDESNLHDKSDGMQIKYNCIPKRTIITIYNYVKAKLDIKINELKNFPD